MAREKRKIVNILQPGNNCWDMAVADKAWVIFDADNYFSALYENLPQAKKQIIFLGWDFDSRLELVRTKRERKAGIPPRFAKLLKHLGQTIPDIEIYILAWDFATLYLPMREMFQKLKFTGARTKFIFDGQHPLGSAHHQKIVVIDDTLAFCGGLDITSNRWDTTKHRSHEPKRSEHGEMYPPFHDMMVGLTGKPAALLGQIARERILRATGDTVAVPSPYANSAENFTISSNNFKNIKVTISRTFPSYRGYDEIREVEALYCDQIQAAESYIYIENQYLTAPVIVDQLSGSLRKEKGPYILIILPEKQSDPMSRMVISGLEAKAIKKLRGSDHQQRLFIGFPYNCGLKPGQFENIHSKLICIDDEHIRIGSANLNNRSMGLDSECDITFLADGNPELNNQFRRETAGMIAHHYGKNCEYVLKQWEGVGLNFRRLLENLNTDSDRQIKEFIIKETPLKVQPLIDFAEQDGTSKLEKTADRLLAKGFKDDVSMFYRVVPVGFISTAIFALLIAALNMKVDFSVSYFPVSFISGVTAPKPADFYLFATIGFLLSSFLLIPFPLIIVWVIACTGAPGIAFIAIGSLLSAIIGYAFGRLSQERPKHLPGRWLPMVNEKMKAGEFWSIFWTRAFPFAPFALISILAGRNKIGIKTFATGSIAGILPYLIAVFFLQIRLLAYLEHPTTKNGVILLALFLVSLYVIRVFQKRFALKASAQDF